MLEKLKDAFDKQKDLESLRTICQEYINEGYTIDQLIFEVKEIINLDKSNNNDIDRYYDLLDILTGWCCPTFRIT